MVRRVIEIDREKCNGCGACADACQEGAIGMVDGKAVLLRDDYCDGLGNCLPHCPANAITFVEREAAAYDEAAVKQAQQLKQQEKMQREGMQIPHGGCPGSRIRQMNRKEDAAAVAEYSNANDAIKSQLRNWPVQIKLAPLQAPYFDGAKLLIAADCTAYAYANFHKEFIRGKVTLIGCPKLDAVNYSEKLTEILRNNDIQSVTILRMEVPCCGGLEMAAKKAIQDSGKFLPWQVVTISIDGEILE